MHRGLDFRTDKYLKHIASRHVPGPGAYGYKEFVGRGSPGYSMRQKFGIKEIS